MGMRRRTVFWIALFGALAALGAGVCLLHGSAGCRAVVYVDGEPYKTVDLTAAAAPYEFTVETEYGRNTVRVSPGAIEVSEADCPNQDCVKQGAISDGAIPIVCLPHHLVIEVKDRNE